MIAEAFEGNKWVEATGVQPVEDDTRVDVKWSDGDVFTNEPAKRIAWYISDVVNVTHWRLHSLVDEALYFGLPKVVCNIPMPPCKPSKQESSNVLIAFNRMTGRDLTEDELNTLSVLLDVFGRK